MSYQCQAQIDVHVRTTIQRVAMYSGRQCSRQAKDQCGPLSLCTQHAKLCPDGFISREGVVAHSVDIKILRDKGIRLFNWRR